MLLMHLSIWLIELLIAIAYDFLTIALVFACVMCVLIDDYVLHHTGIVPTGFKHASIDVYTHADTQHMQSQLQPNQKPDYIRAKPNAAHDDPFDWKQMLDRRRQVSIMN